jgi:hypothetical protein
VACFVYESTGKGTPAADNGYFHGKRWWDWQVSEWVDDLKAGLLFAEELRADQKLPADLVEKAIGASLRGLA